MDRRSKIEGHPGTLGPNLRSIAHDTQSSAFFIKVKHFHGWIEDRRSKVVRGLLARIFDPDGLCSPSLQCTRPPIHVVATRSHGLWSRSYYICYLLLPYTIYHPLSTIYYLICIPLSTMYYLISIYYLLYCSSTIC